MRIEITFLHNLSLPRHRDEGMCLVVEGVVDLKRNLNIEDPLFAMILGLNRGLVSPDLLIIEAHEAQQLLTSVLAFESRLEVSHAE